MMPERTDPLTPTQRSERMSRVRSSGNKSTEGVVAAKLTEAGLGGWEIHPQGIEGRPDFYFPEYRLIVFVDGCFWHACPLCRRRSPSNRGEFWRAKIEETRRRDSRVRRHLRRDGYHVMRIWEHEARKGSWLRRVLTMIRKHGIAVGN